MAGNDISIESVEVTLMSGIGISSAALMKDAYLPSSEENADEGPDISLVPGGGPEQEPAGPDARVYLTKIVNRTPAEEVELLLKKDPGHATPAGNHDFYTVIFIMSIRPGDPSTTCLINGMIRFAFFEETEILAYSPQDKGSITALIENKGDGITLSPGLDFLAPAARNTKVPPDNEELFGIPVGPTEKLIGTYTPKSGYSLAIPAGSLLEYEGLLKNRHEIFWEIYPPMPPRDREMCRDAMLAVFSVIIRTPKNYPPKIRAIMECRVKGNLWGVIPLKGSVDIS